MNYRLPTSSDAPSVVSGGGFFSWGTKFKYTGRTEREILEDTETKQREEPNIQRTSSLRRKASSVPATPSTPLQPHLGYSSLPRSSHSDVGGSRIESSSSTGLLSGLDGNPMFSDIAALETVSEDQEGITTSKLRTTGMNDFIFLKQKQLKYKLLSVLKDDSMDRFSDYYFRDSFEHSSSESQLIDNSYRTYDTTNPSHRSSRSQTPLSHSQIDGRICLPNTSHARRQTQRTRRFNLIRAFLPSFLIVTVLIILMTVIMLETDCELFGSLRNIPEMVSLRYQIYEPVKKFIRDKFVIFVLRS